MEYYFGLARVFPVGFPISLDELNTVRKRILFRISTKCDPVTPFPAQYPRDSFSSWTFSALSKRLFCPRFIGGLAPFCQVFSDSQICLSYFRFRPHLCKKASEYRGYSSRTYYVPRHPTFQLSNCNARQCTHCRCRSLNPARIDLEFPMTSKKLTHATM